MSPGVAHLGVANLNLGVANLALLPKSARRRNLFIRALLLTLRAEKAKIRGEIMVIFVSRAKMRKLNKQFLNHNHDTDVIAFNYDPTPGGPFGDVYISAYQTRVQARALGHSALEEALTLTVHGALHLLGHDDDAPRRKALMFQKQDSIVAKVLAAR